MPRGLKIDLGSIIGGINSLTGNTPEGKVKAFMDAPETKTILGNAFKNTEPEQVLEHVGNFFQRGLDAGVSPDYLNKVMGPLKSIAMAKVEEGRKGDFINGMAQLRGELSGGVDATRTRGPSDFETAATAPAPQYNLGTDETMPEGEPDQRGLPISGLKKRFGLDTGELTLRDRPGREFNESDYLRLNELASRTGRGLPTNVDDAMLRFSSQRETQAQRKVDAEENRRVRRDALAQRGEDLGERRQIQRDTLEQRQQAAQDALNLRRELGGESNALRRESLEERRSAREAAGGSQSETVSEPTARPVDRMVAERGIAKVAQDRGVASLKPEQQAEKLRAIADDFGYELIGDAQVSGSGGFLGLGASPPTLKGDFKLKPKPTTKTTTRTPRGAAPAQQKQQAVRVRDRKSGQTGTYYLDPGEKLPANYEAIQ